MAGTIIGWATESAADPAEDGQAFRREYGLLTSHPDELSRRIRVVRDQAVCARAGHVYSANDHLSPGTYSVVVVAVGDRFIALNLDAMRRQGEFITEVVLDRQFRVVDWIGT